MHIIRKKTKDSDFEDKIKKSLSIIYYILSRPSKIKYFINKKIENRKIKIQTKKYEEYIKNHLNNIKKAYNEIKENPVIFQYGGNELLETLYERVINHDKSKYSIEEFEPYRKNFFPINQKEKEENKQNFEKACEHHYKNNSHHWQYRQNKTSFNKNNQEEILDVLENVLDWLAMGYNFNDRPYQYYEKNKDKIILNEDEKKFLEYIIYEAIDRDYIEREKNNE